MLKIIAGPCQLENLEMGKESVDFLSLLMSKYPVEFIFKTSFDKANRTSGDSPRGAGITEFYKLVAYATDKNVKVLTDVHDTHQPQLTMLGKVCHTLQIPAMLCRQTDLIRAASVACPIINIKKGQFLDPHGMKHARLKADKAKEVWLTERGTTFGYGNLVVDMRSFKIMKEENPDAKVIFDATHSVQLPSARGSSSDGQRSFSLPLAKAALATGYVDGIFLETHIDPDTALSDGPNMIYWRDLPQYMDEICNVFSK